MIKNTVEINSTNENGDEVKVVVKKPTKTQLSEAQLIFSTTFNDALKRGCILRDSLQKYMIDQGLWSKKQEKELDELVELISDGERQLARGGRTADGQKFTKEQARTLALDMRKWRAEHLLLLAQTRRLDSHTVEGEAENAKFDYFMSVCVYNEDGSQHFKNLDDYLEKAEENHQYIAECSNELANIVFNYDPDYEKNQPENKFLIDYNFARDDGRLVNDKGQLVNRDGKLVNEDGYYVDEEGNLIDIDGNKVNNEGSPIEEFVPFED